MSRSIDFIVTSEYDAQKLLPFLKKKAMLSSRLIKSLKRIDNGLQRNGEHIRTVDLIYEGDVISVNMPPELSEIEAVKLDLDIIYEDEDILLINKPPQLAMHPSHNHQGDTLANAAAYHLAVKGESFIFRSIGRLDRDTSGIALCALNAYSAARLTDEIAKKEIKKTYYAIVPGQYAGEGTIDAPIIRPHPLHTCRAVGEGGDRAVTHWRAKRSLNAGTLMEITLETGRTHQIRVHFAHIGSPLLGDDMYGGDTALIKRHALHCGKISLIHPTTNIKMEFEADMPEDMKSIADF